MKLSGMALQLAAQTELKAVVGNEFVLAIPEASRHLTDRAYGDKLKMAIEQFLGRRVRLRSRSAAARRRRGRQEKRDRDCGAGETGAASVTIVRPGRPVTLDARQADSIKPV